ncbi:hypothetical protein CKAH01_08994 [Colletotrichum kahawae]|uniref:Secreted protein n=1 Tax=Colletotrichum kahawae TaxID=34407 RepID=A0AAD9XZD9_COLKA|nr:hypothetical protein CKAH01_08994 [Colletotrichum kahawae]
MGRWGSDHKARSVRRFLSFCIIVDSLLASVGCIQTQQTAYTYFSQNIRSPISPCTRCRGLQLASLSWGNNAASDMLS